MSQNKAKKKKTDVKNTTMTCTEKRSILGIVKLLLNYLVIIHRLNKLREVDLNIYIHTHIHNQFAK